MTSGKQKRQILDARRKAKSEDERLRVQAEKNDKARTAIANLEAVLVKREALAPSNSYGEPDFVTRGYYVDQTFQCPRCEVVETWRATQQKWWYEVAKGSVYSSARYCTACRRKRREGRWREEDSQIVQRKIFAGLGIILPPSPPRVSPPSLPQ
ncbi:hypothetical protein Pan44_27360 [Caulifigura coniformis]|uniref:Probable zinc-binding domain-containing protein n=1 Tax=Caulifigura coniformis TaxID=2527983 RepID=A0A517SEZ3_9PLAN|nr:zinc-ribbon domain containing protein [Caulifigura coniformis]QDT54701.1 hypothetical protein Pan44_27360 [Caulifigura coniformis]